MCIADVVAVPLVPNRACTRCQENREIYRTAHATHGFKRQQMNSVDFNFILFIVISDVVVLNAIVL